MAASISETGLLFDSGKTVPQPSKQRKVFSDVDASSLEHMELESLKRKHISSSDADSSVIYDIRDIIQKALHDSATTESTGGSDPFSDQQSEGKITVDIQSVQQIVSNAVAVAVSAAAAQIHADISSIVNSKCAPLVRTVQRLESENALLHSDLLALQYQSSDLKCLLAKTEDNLNDLQQYTRKVHVRVFGIPEPEDENTSRTAVI